MSSRVLTLTLNPAIDETATLLEGLTPGEVHRANFVRYDVGGKGINVAACLAAYGLPITATGFLGRDNADFFEKFFAERKIIDHFIRIDGATRTNIKLVTKTETTDINMWGLPPHAGAMNTIHNMLKQKSYDVLVLSGSLPPTCPDDIYADLIAIQNSCGGLSVVDCSGKALAAVLAAPSYPQAIKPNIDELSEWAGRPLTTLDDIHNEAMRLNQNGIALVVVSMGSDGALFLTRQKAIHAFLEAEQIESTVGAGDAMVAGIVAATLDHRDLEQIARLATAFSVGKLGLRGANLPPRSRLEELAAQTQCRIL